MSSQLTILVPFYKMEFFEALLSSLEAQSCRSFDLVVVCDGPVSFSASVQARLEGLGARLVIHAANVGKLNPVLHWNRCLMEVKTPWTWLICDDDEMSPECIEVFVDSQKAFPDCDLFRFNTVIIDRAGAVLEANPLHPSWESAGDFLFDRISYKRSSYVSEYVFRTDKLKEFVSYPRAWCSDDATWLQLARAQGIRTLPRGIVRWRSSGDNITSRRFSLFGGRSDAVFLYAKDVSAWASSMPAARAKLFERRLRQFVVRQMIANLEVPRWSSFHAFVSEVLGWGALKSRCGYGLLVPLVWCLRLVR